MKIKSVMLIGAMFVAASLRGAVTVTASQKFVVNATNAVVQSEVPAKITNIVTKAFVEDLGISGGGATTGKLDSASAAPAWVSNAVYTANALVTYNGVIYCNTYGGTFVNDIPPSSDTNWAAKPVSELFLPLTGGEIRGNITFGNGQTAILIEGGGLTIRDWDGSHIWLFYDDGPLTVARRGDLPSLSGQAFDFATTGGVMTALAAVIAELGGSVTNFPSNQ